MTAVVASGPAGGIPVGPIGGPAGGPEPPPPSEPMDGPIVGPEPPPPSQPVDGPIVGWLDQPTEGQVVGPLVRVEGWAFSPETATSRVEVLVNGRSFGPARLGGARLDLATVFAHPHAVISGFEHLVDLSPMPPGAARIVVRAWAGPGRAATLADHELMLAPSSPRVTAAPAAFDARPGPPGALLAARRTRLTRSVGRRAIDGLNLAVVTHDLGLGGAQLWLKELLVRSGAGRTFPCRLLSLAGGPMLEDLEAAGIDVQVSPDGSPSDAGSYEARVAETTMWLAAGGHNAALVNTVVPWSGADAARRLGLPVVWAVHESWRPHELWASLLGEHVAVEVRAQLICSLQRADAVVFVAEATRRLYAGSIGAGRSVVVPYGIDMDEVEAFRRSMSRAQARAALGLDPGRTMILALGIVQPRKAQTILAAAFVEVADEFPQADLAIVGDIGGDYAQALVEYLRRQGLKRRIRVVPATGEPYVWYRAADGFVCGSDNESMPRTILEALAFGLPLAATSVFGIPDVVVDGRTGHLFEARDKDAAVRALRWLLGADRADLDRVAGAGRRLALDSFDSSAYTCDLVALLEGLRVDPAARPTDILARVNARPSA